MNKEKNTMNDYSDRILRIFLEETQELSKEKKIRILERKIRFFSNREDFIVAAVLKREQDRLKMKKKDIVISFFRDALKKIKNLLN